MQSHTLPTAKGLRQNNLGFTLIEVMLVILLVGFMVSAVQFTSQNNQTEKQLEQASKRFIGLFEIAAEYSLLNNVELGVIFDKTSYQFVGYDGTQWAPIANNDVLIDYQLPESIELELSLEDLPIEEPQLFDAETFLVEDDDFRAEKKPKLIPQVVILSGGEISPFSVIFRPSADVDSEDISFKVTGLYTTPLLLTGPLFDE